MKNFNLKIYPNETTALVGQSGAGKSTVVQLIERYYDPNFGEILIDNVNIKEYDLKFLRRQFGIVSQEPVLFNDTIEANIKYSDELKQMKDVKRALEVAKASDFVGRIGEGDLHDPVAKGLQYVCGTKGSKLSGG